MGVVGASLVFRWSWGLLKQSARVLLDRQAPDHVRHAIVEAIERHTTNKISDLHVWSIGPGYYAVEIAIITDEPRSPDDYRRMLPVDLGLVHVIVEVARH